MWTYSGNPASSTRNAVRFYLGDTNTNDQQISDEELDFLIALYPIDIIAAYYAATSISQRYAGAVQSKSIDGLSITYGDRYKHYSSLAMSLLSHAALHGSSIARPYAGGISISDYIEVQNDPDRLAPAFSRGMMEDKNYGDEAPKFGSGFDAGFDSGF